MPWPRLHDEAAWSVKTIYLDLSSGISGDMFLGALLDLGVSLTALETALESLALPGWHAQATRAEKQGIAGIRFEVCLAAPDGHEHDHHPGASVIPGYEPAGPSTHVTGHRDFREIEALIAASPLSNWVKETSVAVFRRIAAAEGKIHGRAPEEVHFHEVGALDSIIDILGACLALEMLGQPRLLASSVVDGHGWLECAHGRYPVPAPATLEVLAARGVTVTQCEEPHELVTPTGAALLAELVDTFGPMPAMRVSRVGYGLGRRNLASRPNVLRVILGECQSTAPGSASDWETDTVAVLETNLDDATPQMLGHFAEQMLAAGAWDVFFTPIQMKKGRPAAMLTVLCPVEEADRFTERMLRETTAFGVRRTLADRRKLRREFRTVPTTYGDVLVKLGTLNGEVVHVAPEFDSCRQAALRCQVPLREVYEAARRALTSPGSGVQPGA